MQWFIPLVPQEIKIGYDKAHDSSGAATRQGRARACKHGRKIKEEKPRITM